ncbi:Putative acetolactate synthase small subunit [Candidatus Xiphinematobacter sp. Idaho Grape]|uniref:acetolactate synthase small subunit n=1 Tax=Candidatus Xiphinematobacter sp. Idaho Grape TaxID=1704307 RepID=UPI0007062CBC|nr:acetolactate synthase small subunit [Candidatus Xiphinematobacter sp. Idaho Grape]ALJ56466.1 Putative acetolactate synthase small subunit [Candidatus Xiphinematobacter sp. Idaho Grape]
MCHTITVVVENRFGVLSRVVGMFSGRGFNIDALNVSPTRDSSTSCMTIAVRGDNKTLEQVTHHLEKLVDVISVKDHRGGEYIDRELVLLRVCAGPGTRAELIQICEAFRAKVVGVHPTELTIELTGSENKIAKFLSLMEDFRIEDLVRTGKVALPRSP